MKPTAIEAGQRWHDDDEKDDPDYGERNYTVIEFIGIRSWLDGEQPWWSVKYADGYESESPASWILRDTFVGKEG